jgi:H+/Cl- antiporter ClcA
MKNITFSSKRLVRKKRLRYVGIFTVIYALLLLIIWIHPIGYGCDTKAFHNSKFYLKPFIAVFLIAFIFIAIVTHSDSLPSRKDWHYDECD